MPTNKSFASSLTRIFIFAIPLPSPSSAFVGKPMRIEIVVDPTKTPSGPSLASRVAPAAPVQPTTTVTRGGPRRGRGRGGKRRNDRPAKSAADLDAEMEDYTSNTTAAAPAAAA
ncbi:hypothetical protein GYMLUDRAFT_725432 [Collybiopsis luxurians FD-317 M1]|nr:hypothetical protein GYMLUDRAFT_725432 [Collybiopsis luxurians FD-317 M1]